MEKRNWHCTVGKSSLEQQFLKSDKITFAVLNIWSCAPSTIESFGRLADKMQVINKIFKIQIINFS